MALSDLETEYDDDDFEESCDHGKFDDEECPECDAYFAAHPEDDEDGTGADADGSDATDEPVDEDHSDG